MACEPAAAAPLVEVFVLYVPVFVVAVVFVVMVLVGRVVLVLLLLLGPWRLGEERGPVGVGVLLSLSPGERVFFMGRGSLGERVVFMLVDAGVVLDVSREDVVLWGRLCNRIKEYKYT